MTSFSETGGDDENIWNNDEEIGWLKEDSAT
jgi:hypothetical protein